MKFFPDKYVVSISDYKIIIKENIWHTALVNTILFVIAFAACGIWWVLTPIFLFIILVSRFFSEKDALIEIDEVKRTIKLRNQEEFNISEVNQIKISEVNIGGYLYNYLQFVNPDNHTWSVLKINSVPFCKKESESEQLAKLIAEKLQMNILRE